MIIFRSRRPILNAEKEWEAGGIQSAVGAFPEPGDEAIRLYYHVSFPRAPQRNVLCLARSSDLQTWEKPDLGDGTNIVMHGSGNEVGYGTFLPCRILWSDADATGSGGWSLLYWDRLHRDQEPGFCLAKSPDGLTWHAITDRPVITGANDAGSMIRVRDEHPTPLGKAAYYIYQQTWRHDPALPQERDNLKGLHRRISLWRASSLKGSWRGPVLILEPDEDDPPDVQFYWLSPFHVDGGYGAFLHCHHTLDQTMDVQLVSSRDGWSWDRCMRRRPLLPLGDRGRFDCGMVYIWSAPVRWRNRLLVFYSGRATVHDHRLRYPEDALPDPSAGIGVAELASEVLTALPQ